MDFQEVLNAVTAGTSDNKTSQKLGITRQMFSAYRNGRKNPSDEVLNKMIEISGLPAGKVYLAAYAEKLHNAEAAAVFRTLAA